MIDKKSQEENRKKWAQVVAKAWQDPAFKTKLLKSPAQTLKEFGIEGKGMTYKIVEASKDETYFILPAKPEGKLSEAELRNIAAAASSMTGSGPACC